MTCLNLSIGRSIESIEHYGKWPNNQICSNTQVRMMTFKYHTYLCMWPFWLRHLTYKGKSKHKRRIPLSGHFHTSFQKLIHIYQWGSIRMRWKIWLDSMSKCFLLSASNSNNFKAKKVHFNKFQIGKSKKLWHYFTSILKL